MTETWDWTKLSAYACEMRGHLGMERHLQPKEPSEALVFGQAFHKAVEVWTRESLAPRTSYAGEVTGIDPFDPRSMGKRAFLAVWDGGLPLELREKLEIEGDRRSYGNFCRLFDAFVRRFPIEMFDKIVATETPFSLYLGKTPGGREVNWSGILDRAVEWQGGVYYVDIKTSSFPLDDEFFSQFRLSGQMIGYAWAGREMGLGNFEGVMIQGVEVRVPQEGVKLKKDGTPYKQQGRSADAMIGLDIVPVSDEHIEEWKADTLEKIDRIYRARERKVWVRDRGELCTKYRGGCKFRRVCLAAPEMREKVIEENFEVREWNPLRREEV